MATTTAPEQKSSLGNIGTLLIVGGGAFVLWRGFSMLNDYLSRKRTEEAEKNIIKSTTNIIKTKERISSIEGKSFVTGINSYGKKSTVNLVNQVKEIINSYFITIVDKNGLNKYFPKADPNGENIVKSVFETPVKNLKDLSKIYSIYTGRNFLNDIQKLSPKQYQSIKAVYTVAFKKYGS